MSVIMVRKGKKKRVHTAWEKKLRALREKRGLTQKQAADQAGVQLRTWISWENSQYTPSRLIQLGLKTIFPDLE